MCLHGIAERRQHRSAKVGNLLFELRNQTLDASAFQVGLRAGQVAWNDRKLSLRHKFGDLFSAAISQRTNDRIAPVVRTEHRRHGFQGADVEQVQKERCDDVVSMMTEGYLRALFLDRAVVENAAPQSRANGTIG